MVNRPMGHVTPNVLMNTALLEAAYAVGVKLFVFMSSGAAYPDEGGGILDVEWTEDDLFVGDPSAVYYAVGWMKRYTEILCRTYAEKVPGRKMGVLVIRPSNVYGPHDKFDPKRSHVMASLIRRVAAKEDPIMLWGTGDERRDFVYIDDFVDGVFKAMDYQNLQEKFSVFNIASGTTYTVRQVLEQLFAVGGWAPKCFSFDHTKPSTVPVRKISAKLAKVRLDWEAKTSLQEGLKKTLDWYQKEYPDV
jgi:GDP-L-fucose synthase